MRRDCGIFVPSAQPEIGQRSPIANPTAKMAQAVRMSLVDGKAKRRVACPLLFKSVFQFGR